MALHVFCTPLTLKQNYSIEQKVSCFEKPQSHQDIKSPAVEQICVLLGRHMLG